MNRRTFAKQALALFGLGGATTLASGTVTKAAMWYVDKVDHKRGVVILGDIPPDFTPVLDIFGIKGIPIMDEKGWPTELMITHINKKTHELFVQGLSGARFMIYPEHISAVTGNRELMSHRQINEVLREYYRARMDPIT